MRKYMIQKIKRIFLEEDATPAPDFNPTQYK
jgi:hypothetical protein